MAIKLLQKNTINIKLLVGFILIMVSSGYYHGALFAHYGFLKSSIFILIGGLLYLLTLYNQLKKKDTIVFNITYLKFSLFALFMLGTLSIFWSVNIEFTLTKWLLWLSSFYIFYIAYHIEQTKENIFIIVFGLLIASGIISIIGISQYLFNFDFIAQSSPPASTFGNKNMAIQPLILMFPLSLYLLFLDRLTKIQTYIVGFLLSTVLIYIFYSTTRAGWVSVGIEILLILLFLFINRSNIDKFIKWNKTKTFTLIFSFIFNTVSSILRALSHKRL